MEDAEAIICLTCGYNTQTRTQGRTEKTIANTGGDYVLWLLPGVVDVLLWPKAQLMHVARDVVGRFEILPGVFP